MKLKRSVKWLVVKQKYKYQWPPCKRATCNFKTDKPLRISTAYTNYWREELRENVKVLENENILKKNMNIGR